MNTFSTLSKKYKIEIIVGAIVVVLCLGIGYYFGKHAEAQEDRVLNLINKSPAGAPPVDFAPFWQVWNDINQYYVPTNGTTTPVSDQTRVYGAIQGMVASLGDPYTVFFPPVQNTSFNDQISGTFAGVGMEVDTVSGVLTVTTPLKDNPAYNAGVKAGDKILEIDGQSTSAMTTDQAVAAIRGAAGTTVKLTLSRAGVKAPFVISIVRAIINTPTINTEQIGDVFVIQLYTFTATSPDLFRNALREFVDSGDSKLVIDLRGNPGGYLEAAVDMASWFLPVGKTVVSEDFLNQTQNQVYKSLGYNIFSDKLKLVVLIDGGSASASEILSGALHDNGVATLVGEQSFGKGSVQELIPITPTTSLKVTIAKWLTPNGISISHQGLTPDVVVPLDPTKFAAGDDTQMDKAVQILDGK